MVDCHNFSHMDDCKRAILARVCDSSLHEAPSVPKYSCASPQNSSAAPQDSRAVSLLPSYTRVFFA